MKKILVNLFVILVAFVPLTLNAQLFKKPVSRNIYDQKIFDLCTEIGSTMNKKDSTKMAISEFYSLDGSRSPYALFLNESITIELFKTHKFKILEKGRLEKTLKEQKMELNGVADGEVAKKVGKILDIKAIMAGTIIELPNTIRINARLISTETGIIVAASSIEIDKKMVMPFYPAVQKEEEDVPANNIEGQNSRINEEPSLTMGNYNIQLVNIRVAGNDVIAEVSFLNNGIDEELNFGDAKVPGYKSELVGPTLRYPLGGVSAVSGKKLTTTDPRMLFKKYQKEIMVFKFNGAAIEFANLRYFQILIKGRSFPKDAVLKIGLNE